MVGSPLSHSSVMMRAAGTGGPLPAHRKKGNAMQAMSTEPNGLQEFVADLRRITAESDDPGRITQAVRPLAQRLAQDKSWVEERFYRPNEEQGFSATLLHEEPDHSLAVLAVSWLPGRGAPPHDHGTWAVVAGVDGPEKNTFWKRVDDRSRPGYAEIVKAGEKVFGDGEVLTMIPGSIHSVDNESD